MEGSDAHIGMLVKGRIGSGPQNVAKMVSLQSLINTIAVIARLWTARMHSPMCDTQYARSALFSASFIVGPCCSAEVKSQIASVDFRGSDYALRVEHV